MERIPPPARRRLLRLAKAVLALALSGYLVIAGLRLYEYFVTFHPNRVAANQPLALPEGATEVWFPTREGIRLNGWYVRAANDAPLATILFFHGNGGNLIHLRDLLAQLRRQGFDVLAFDYQGYGRSEGSIHDERDLFADADAAYEFLVRSRGLDPGRLVLYGQSLGTAAAADLASRQRCAALILESGMSSASSLAARILPWLPVCLHRFGRNQLDSARKLPRVHCPVFIAHGEPDEIVPTDEGRTLFAAANEPKELLIVPGAGHGVFYRAGNVYYERLAAFAQAALEEGTRNRRK